MNISVIGTGYVGLVTGTCFAESGNNVICVDIDQNKVEKLRNGQVTIYEPGLEKIFLRNIKEGRLKFTTTLKEAVECSDIIFLALPTPPGADGRADLNFVLRVADQLGRILNGYKVIVNKSTVPVGTSEKVYLEIRKNYKGDFDVVSNPEFLREGVAVDDFMKPDRVVIGTVSNKAKTLMSELYAPFVRQGNPIIFMDERSAELTKYAANSFLATKISFMNEIAQLCERMGADVDMIRIGIGSDDRIGKRFLFPGIGYGGSCFPKDVKALIRTARENGHEMRILQAVEDVNDDQKSVLFDKISKHFKGDLKGKSFAIWGLSFKPKTDDMREAPSLVIIEKLLGAGASVKAYDPVAMHEAKKELGEQIEYSKDPNDALIDADALLIVTEWPEFRTPNFKVMGKLMKSKLVFDGRNIYDLEEMTEHGFDYYCIGVNTTK